MCIRDRTLPAATALLGASSIGRVMLLAAGIAAVDIVGGLAVAYETDSPAGAVIVLGAATVYLLALSAQGLRRRKRHSTVPASDAVSYTHLDVYKRQGVGRGEGLGVVGWVRSAGWE